MESDGIFVDVVTEGIDPDVAREVCVFGDVVVGVLDALIMVVFVVVMDAFVIVGFAVVMVAVVGSLVDAAVDVEVVVVMGVVCVFGDGVAGFCHEPEIRKDVSWLLRDKCATKSVVIRQGYLF